MVNLLQVIAVTVSHHEAAVEAIVIWPTVVVCFLFAAASFGAAVKDIIMMHRLLVHRMRARPSAGFGETADAWFGTRPAGIDVMEAAFPETARTVCVSPWGTRTSAGVPVPAVMIHRL